MSATLRRDVEFGLIPQAQADEPEVPVSVALLYNPADPYAVFARFTIGPTTEVVWVFDRELLRRGLRERAGLGDVRFAPIPDRPGYVQLVLTSADSAAVFAIETADLREFLTSTYARVPAGTELDHVDLDEELVALLEADFPEPGESPR